MVARGITLFSMLFLVACAPVLSDRGVSHLRDQVIDEDTLWQGTIIIDGSVTFKRGTTLTIQPGTEVRFVPRDEDQDGLGDSRLVIEGRFIAEGTEKRPIRFWSAGTDPKPGDWLELRIDHSPEARLSYVDIRHSAHSIHAHFTRLSVTNATIRENIDGCRLGESKADITYSLIEENLGKGLNYRNSVVTITNNIIRNNRSGLFIFETNRPATISNNNLIDNDISIRLGDFFQGDVSVAGNWWGGTDPADIDGKIYDKKDDSTIGTISYEQVDRWVADAGPRRTLSISPLAKIATDGFIDAPPVKVSLEDGTTGVLVAAWDGYLRLLNLAGDILWQQQVGDIVDASPLVFRDIVYIQSWRPEVVALSLVDGTILWRTPLAPSPQDDHRQADLAMVNGSLFVPSWNGTLYQIDPDNGTIISETEVGAPLRSGIHSVGQTIYSASGAGTLTALTLDGDTHWQNRYDSPLLSSPISTRADIIFVDKSGTVRSVDARAGTLRWSRELEEPTYYSSPLLTDEGLFVATAGEGLWRLDPESGKAIWRQQLNGASYATPVMVEGFVAIGNNNGSLEFFDPLSGLKVATISTDGAIQGKPLRIEDRLYIGSRDHRFHIFFIGGEQR